MIMVVPMQAKDVNTARSDDHLGTRAADIDVAFDFVASSSEVVVVVVVEF